MVELRSGFDAFMPGRKQRAERVIPLVGIECAYFLAKNRLVIRGEGSPAQAKGTGDHFAGNP